MELSQKPLPLEALRFQLVNRPANGHKGTFGTVLVIGGSWGMSGAPALCGLAALRCGAGLVKLAIPERILPITAGLGLEFTTVSLPETSGGQIAKSALSQLLTLAGTATIAAVGPGLGRSEDLDFLISELWKRLPIPAVFDADALNALAVRSFPQNGTLPEHAGIRIVTPHPGEFSRLMPDSPATDSETQRRNAVRFARQNDCVTVLKGRGTQITDGNQIFRNSTGNSGMATGGSGDVLTGVTAALGAQLFRKSVSPLDATRLAVYLHGRAGDLAARELGECSLIASDLIRFLPPAIQKTEALPPLCGTP